MMGTQNNHLNVKYCTEKAYVQLLLWKLWCLLGLPVMPNTPRVAAPAPRATTAEADRATIAVDAIPFSPAKLHKTNVHFHQLVTVISYASLLIPHSLQQSQQK